MTNEKELSGIDFLTDPKNDQGIAVPDEVSEKTARRLEDVLAEYGFNGKIVNVRSGPVVTRFEFEPAADNIEEMYKIIWLEDDIARATGALAVRMTVNSDQNVIGSSVIGIEMPNEKRAEIRLKEILDRDEFRKSERPLLSALGKDIEGKPVFVDLTRSPGMLIAGTTGAGKSTLLHAVILSLVCRLTPERVRFILIDPKMLEFSAYKDIPHLLTPVITDPEKAMSALCWAARETERRLARINETGARNIDVYNRKVSNPLPHIVVIADEMADLMLTEGKKVDAAVQRIVQNAWDTGIHLILATQRPSADVITDTIKMSCLDRTCFRLTSRFDGRRCGVEGAERLLGRGDMLYYTNGLNNDVRLHAPFVGDNEIEAVTTHLRQQGVPEYDPSVLETPPDDDPNEGGEVLR